MVDEKIKIGVLFSQTGSMAVTENAHLQGIILACEEINQNGGINGASLEPIILNPKGNDRLYAEMATELLLKHKVSTIFGCCLSTSRKAVIPIVERFNGILFYPSVYEGFEYSPNVIYGGAVPNQSILPLLDYIYSNKGKKFILFGSDTLYSREVNRIVSEFLDSSGGTIVYESYFPFGTNLKSMKASIELATKDDSDVILSTVVGEDSIIFYTAYSEIQMSEKKPTIASLTTTESELAKMQPNHRAGHISVSSYFGSLDNKQNHYFLTAFKDKYGYGSIPSVYSEVCYSLVHLLANAICLSDTTDTEDILHILSGAVFKGPCGDLSIDIGTNHFTSRSYIGVSTQEGGFDIVQKSSSIIRPDPYLVSYDRSIN